MAAGEGHAADVGLGRNGADCKPIPTSPVNMMFRVDGPAGPAAAANLQGTDTEGGVLEPATAAAPVAEAAPAAAPVASATPAPALAEVRARTESSGGSPPDAAPRSPGAPAGERMGTPYVPGMLGKPGWREEGLVDPAALLPAGDRDRVGIPSSTRSEILEEPYGMGRRWTSGDRSAGLYYRLTPEHRDWLPPGGLVLDADAGGALFADLDDGRSVMFLGADAVQVVLEATGLAHDERTALAESVAARLAQFG